MKNKININSKYEDGAIKETFFELLLYSFFLILASIISISTSGVIMYYLPQTIIRGIVQRPFESMNQFELTFEDIAIIPEYWRFLSTVLLETVHEDTEMLEDEKEFNQSLSSDSLKVTSENYILGTVRIRQLRVRDDTCLIHSVFKKYFRDCFGFYSPKNEDHSPIGVHNITAYHYYSADEIDSTKIWGQLTVYSGGGYYYDFDISRSPNEKMLERLQKFNWITRGTRAVFVEFTVYNPNVNMFCVIKLIAETPPTGGVITSYNMRTIKLLGFLSYYDYLILFCQLLFGVQLIWYTSVEIIELCALKWNYFKSFWNWLDISIISIGLFGLAFLVFRYFHMRTLLKRYETAPDKYISFDFIAFWQIQYNNMMGICVFMIWIKVFKFISFNSTMIQFSTTLKRCAFDLLGFGFMFLIVFIAFGQLGYVLFGTDNSNFRTFRDSIFTLFRTILGDFDYLAIEKANRILGPIYFLTFIFLVFFVLLNMFLAIINDTYSNVKTEISESRIDVGLYIRKQWNKWNRRLCPMYKCCLCNEKRIARDEKRLAQHQHGLSGKTTSDVPTRTLREQSTETRSSDSNIKLFDIYEVVHDSNATENEKIIERIEALEMAMDFYGQEQQKVKKALNYLLRARRNAEQRSRIQYKPQRDP